MVYIPREQQEKLAELEQQERVRAWFENERKKAAEWKPKAVSENEQSSVDSDDESEESLGVKNSD